MKRSVPLVVFVGSLVANLALVGALVFRSGGDASSSESSAAQAAARPGSSRASASSSPNSAATPAVETAHASAKVRADTWSALDAGGDLPTLVANLRAAGFPPKLVRSIVASMVSEQFAARRRAIRGDQEDAPFWKSGNRLAFDFSKQADLRALYREQSDLLKSLLGDEEPSDESRQTQRRMYGPLPADKLDMVARINADYQELSMQIQIESNGIMLPWDREQLAMIEKEKRADLVATLSPEELEMFDLYGSSTANSLRSRLASFQPTEQEFRDLFELQRVYDEKYNPRYGPGVMDQAAMQERAAAQRELNEQIKATLGEDRYAEYQRAQDFGYRTASRIVERLKLPPENAAAVYDLQKSAQQQAAQIRSDRTQTDEARAEALATLAREANERVVSLLGAQGAEAYTQSGGGWLRSLSGAPRSGGAPVLMQRGTAIRVPAGG